MRVKSQLRNKTLTENISSWMELVFFLFLLLHFLPRKCLFSVLRLGADVDLSVVVESLMGRRCRNSFRDGVFDVLIARRTSQNPRPHLGVRDGCRQETIKKKTHGHTITVKYFIRLQTCLFIFCTASVQLLITPLQTLRIKNKISFSELKK